MNPPNSSQLPSSMSTFSFQTDRPQPVPGDRAISASEVKKQPRFFRSNSATQRKTSRGTSLSISQRRPSNSRSAATQSASSSISGQASVSVAPRASFMNERSRKRDKVQKWLEKHAHRFGRLASHRDSMFDIPDHDIKQVLKLASQHKEVMVSGPLNEPVPQRVIEHFFTLCPVGGSDWRNSERWDSHLAKCKEWDCLVCKSMGGRPHSEAVSRTASAPMDMVKTPSTSSVPRPSNDLSLLKNDQHSTLSKTEQKRKCVIFPDEPEEPLSDMEDEEYYCARARTAKFHQSQKLKTPVPLRSGLFIDDGCARPVPRLIRTASVSKPLDASQLAFPAAPDREPVLDLTSAAHCTEKSYGKCLLPLVPIPFSAPATPKLQPDRDAAPVPDIAQLADCRDSVLSAPSSVAASTQYWPSEPQQTLPIPTTAAHPPLLPTFQYTTPNGTTTQPSLPLGPADKDPSQCVLADTTGSSLPDAPVYVGPPKRRARWWAGMKRRYREWDVRWRV